MTTRGRPSHLDRTRRTALLGALAVLIASCAGTGSAQTGASRGPAGEVRTVGCDGEPITLGVVTSCSVPGWEDRDFDVYLPDDYDPAVVWPVIIAYHGGGGRREVAAETTCPEGDRADSGCLHSVGIREGFITVYPDGTARRVGGRLRTWNAGGAGGLTCVVGAACDRGVDDIAYTSDLLDVLDDYYSIEPRVTVTGLSNGGAMAHRAGCDLSERVAVVVAFGGANQQPGCTPAVPVSVLHVHGTEDPCWPYGGGELGGCLGGRARISGAVETAEGWASAEHCAAPVESTLPDAVDDGSTSTLRRWEGCDGGAAVELVTVVGGGHTWPMGHSVAPRIVGASTLDFSGNRLLWEFVQSASS